MTTPTPSPGFMVQIKKRVAASREEVFRSWTSPDAIRRWMVPSGGRETPAELDVRVGGKYRINMICGDGEFEHWGEYLRVEPPRLLEFTWISQGTRNHSTLITVELLERDAETEVVLTHSRFPDQKMADDHREGWDELVTSLARVLGSASA